MKFISLMMILVLFTGCTFVRGPRMSQDEVSIIQDGHTTKNQLIDLLGYPENISHDDKTATEEYVYVNQLFKPRLPASCFIADMLILGILIPYCSQDHSQVDTKRLSVTIGFSGVVQKHYFDQMTSYGLSQPAIYNGYYYNQQQQQQSQQQLQANQQALQEQEAMGQQGIQQMQNNFQAQQQQSNNFQQQQQQQQQQQNNRF